MKWKVVKLLSIGEDKKLFYALLNTHSNEYSYANPRETFLYQFCAVLNGSEQQGEPDEVHCTEAYFKGLIIRYVNAS